MSSSYDELGTGMKLPVLKNAEKNFATWRIRFMAYAAVKKYRVAVQDQRDPDLPTVHQDPELYDITDPDELKSKKAIKRNTITVAAYTMAFEEEKHHNMVFKSMNANWPEGNAKAITTALLTKYKPNDISQRRK
jgi:hypothetical protein